MKSYSQIMSAAIKARTDAQKNLDLVFHIGMEVDEVAVYFEKKGDLDQFLAYAVNQGMEHFNSVPSDAMHQIYGNSEMGIPNRAGHAFDVRFEFLRIPNSDWRIEAMQVLDGWAPLHRRLRSGEIAHVSGKVQAGSLHYYSVLRAALSKRLTCQAEYLNSYGRFAYFGDEAPYFKPRVNLSAGN